MSHFRIGRSAVWPPVLPRARHVDDFGLVVRRAAPSWFWRCPQRVRSYSVEKHTSSRNIACHGPGHAPPKSQGAPGPPAGTQAVCARRSSTRRTRRPTPGRRGVASTQRVCVVRQQRLDGSFSQPRRVNRGWLCHTRAAAAVAWRRRVAAASPTERRRLLVRRTAQTAMRVCLCSIGISLLLCIADSGGSVARLLAACASIGCCGGCCCRAARDWGSRAATHRSHWSRSRVAEEVTATGCCSGARWLATSAWGAASCRTLRATRTATGGGPRLLPRRRARPARHAAACCAGFLIHRAPLYFV